MITDTHAHLYYPELITQIDDVIARADDAGIKRIIVPAVDAVTSEEIINLSVKYPVIFCAVGIHPCDVNNSDYSSMEKIEELLRNEKVIAIGETGLDYYWDKTNIKRQKEFFRLHIELSKRYRLPVVIHTRNSVSDAVSMIEENIDSDLTGQFHCFSGNKDELNRILNFKNFYVSYCGNVTYKNFSGREIVEATPPDRILSETDSPFLPPVPHRGKKNEPSFVVHTLKAIADIKEIPYEELTEAIDNNVKSLFF